MYTLWKGLGPPLKHPTEKTGRDWSSLRIVYFLGGFFTLLLATLPSFLGEHPASQWLARALQFVVLKPFCHQLPARTPEIYSEPLGLCFRCLFLLLGGLGGCLIFRWFPLFSRKEARSLCAGALLPLFMDVLCQSGGLYSSNFSRGLSGGIAGLGVSIALLSHLRSPMEG